MAHRVASDAEADLQAIWYYVATESSSVAIADRLIDSLTNRFLLLATHSYLGRSRVQDFGFEARSFPVASTSSSTSSKAQTYSSFASSTDGDLEILFSR